MGEFKKNKSWEPEMKMKAGMIHHFHIQKQAYKRPPESVIFYPWGTNCIGKKNSQQLINREYNKDHVESQLTKGWRYSLGENYWNTKQREKQTVYHLF